MARHGWPVHHQARADLDAKMCFRVPHFGFVSGSGSGSHSNSFSIFLKNFNCRSICLPPHISIIRLFWTLIVAACACPQKHTLEVSSHWYINMTGMTLPGIFNHPPADDQDSTYHAHNNRSNATERERGVGGTCFRGNGPSSVYNICDAQSNLAAQVTIYYATQIIYNVFFHPLSRFPGPISHAISRLPYCYYALIGTLPFHMLDLHNQYGDIVRIAPDELAFSHPNAWKDIMGHKNGEEELGKADWFYRPLPEARHIVNEERDQHKGLRRAMAHGFSEKAMREQEPLIRKYTDLLLERLREQSKSGQSVAISDWYNFTTFDIIGDLAFGEAFGCLENAKYDYWIKTIFESGRLGIILQSISFYPILKSLLLLLVPKSLQEAQQKHKALTTTKMLRRLAIIEDRPDLINSLLKKKEDLVSCE